MVTYALDASALLRFLDDEPGALKVSEILNRHVEGKCAVIVSTLHWGEMAGVLYKRDGDKDLDRILSRLSGLGMQMVPVTQERAVRAAILKADLKIPYADAFGIELAQNVPCTFVTADYDLKPAANRAEIIFLPKK
ncbi:MAG: PIN domain-containing protein [Acidobacteriaceae bacterium]